MLLGRGYDGGGGLRTLFCDVAILKVPNYSQRHSIYQHTRLFAHNCSRHRSCRAEHQRMKLYLNNISI